MRYDLTDFEWSVIEPLLPKNRRGVKPKNNRRILNGIFWVLRAGASWRDLPDRYGPYTTAYNRTISDRQIDLTRFARRGGCRGGESIGELPVFVRGGILPVCSPDSQGRNRNWPQFN